MLSIMKIGKKIIFTSLSLLFWIVLWHIISAKVNMELVFPSPHETLKTLVNVVKNPDFLKICFNSVLRIFIGTLFGIFIGVFLAVLSYAFEVAKYLISPVMTVVKATPVASFIILLLVLIGKEYIPSVTAAIISIPILYANILGALESTDKDLKEVCRVYSLNFSKSLRALWIPSAMPKFISGIKSCIGLSWKAGIAAEVLCTPRESIGIKIYESKVYLETPTLFAWTAVVVILSLIFEKAALGIVKERKKNEHRS